MTIKKLVIRSMGKNIKMYYLYFFSMIFSISLYFIFSTLQNDQTIVNMSKTSMNFSASFQVAGILLTFITIVFTMYATSIFIRRRSQEIGLYQLIGLSKAWVARVLILEHTILGLGALLIGMLVGTLLSRLFILMFMNLIGLEAMIGLTFSSQAVIQTIAVFTCLIAVTSLQIILKVYRSTLLQLFQANNQNDYFVKRPSILSSILGLAGLSLIGFGYYVSTFIVDHADLLMFLMLLVLASTILGTYLVFHTTISWILYVFRKKQNGNLGLYNSLSVAPLMHRMKGHANSLTLITVLSAATITMISLSYSLYYSTENDVRLAMPFDFAVENMQDEAAIISSRLEEEQIEFYHYQLDAIRFNGTWVEQGPNVDNRHRRFMLFSAEQMAQAGLDVESPQDDEAIYYNTRAIIEGMDTSFPKDVQYASKDEVNQLTVSKFRIENVMNYRFYGQQLLVSEETFQRMRDSIQDDEYKEFLTFEVFQLLDTEKSDMASDIFLTSLDSDLYITDFYSAYEGSRQTFGLLIFIAGILGFVFILSTGSILYFKQMTEAEQEKTHYRILRQLGFQVKDIMKGIVRKQLFVYLIPLGIGLIHAAFALNVGSILMAASMLTPIIISMVAYIVIYLMFAAFTIRYYKNIVINAL
ncbi:bacitracin ABC transport system permease protein BceB [Clostridium aceticum]|uniref:Bacitracin ABC transport system permease protein BceB n=1 Tax=Clostridium aceticum TaxID=84022 RepID=A0A0D8ICJ5_9CLOT|nr:ABC transporter permease [Clostridium aceticum]AKL95156.1 bacitracin ABC transport system permease protein BceB [Clostridium aceticum]KJF28030.1 cell division protein FtsX [Clostridium aceticum]